ncbi:MAG: efflux RND transporter periplasmic adaptor subunit [Proteobacteria bacterium]|nr:efflux RND transporter periplasmic adaptor subunit [Pseudomonadota bacterium]
MNSKNDKSAEKHNEIKTGIGLSRSPGKFWLTATVVAVVVIIGIVAGLIPRLLQRAGLRAETKDLSVHTVTVVSPKPGQSVSNLSLPAEVKALVETPIYSRANGYLKRRFVDIGSQVKEGQLLAEIDAPELNQELERACGQLAQAEAALGLSKITAERWAGLVKTASVSEQENAEKQADFKLKTASTESARAEVGRLQKLESFLRLTAPFAGVITVRNIDSGDLIVAGAGKELFHLAQTGRLRVFVQVPQAMARSIRTGQTAEMTFLELPNRTFKPRVIRTAGVMASDSRTLLVELALDNPKEEVLAGGYAQVRFTEANLESTLTLPANTVLFRPEGPQVGIVQLDGKVEMRIVKLGRDFGQTIEILTGVNPKDRVIVNPSDSLATGTTVSVDQADKKEKSR